MSEPSAPPAPAPAAPAPAPAPAPQRRGRALRKLVLGFSGYMFSLVAGLALVIGGAAWLLYSEAGAVWLLARVPALQVSGVRGALLGDFGAQSVTLPLPGDGAQLKLQDLRWRGWQLHSASHGIGLRVGLDELSLGRVDVLLPSVAAAPMAPPQSLALPIGFELKSLHIGELRIDGLDTPLRELKARLSLGADDGATHRVEELTVLWDRLQVAGRLHVATAGGLDLDASAELTQQLGASGEWNATLKLSGPLAAPQLTARLRAQPAPPRPAQTLDASATLHPFAPWPLGDLQASARSLDLSALHSQAPITALDVDASAKTRGRDQPAAVSLALSNPAAGRWNEGRLPLRQLKLELRARPDEPSHLEVQTFEAELGSTQAAAGRMTGQGHWNPATWRVDARLSALRPALLDVRAPDMRLDGQLRFDGSGFGANSAQGAQLDVVGSLQGQLQGQLQGRGPQQPVQLRIDARLGALRIELRELLAQAGGARATLTGQLSRASTSAAWAARGQATLREFDPLQWWPGREDSPWRKGPHRVNATADFDLSLPASASASASALAPTLLQQLAQTRGQVQLGLEPSRLAGVPVSGNLSMQSAADGKTLAKLQLDADGNSLLADAQLGILADGSSDRWELRAQMPALNRIQPLWRLLLDGNADSRLAGALSAQATLSGRWPAVTTQGQLTASDLQLGNASA